MYAQRFGAHFLLFLFLGLTPASAENAVWISGQNQESNYMRVFNVSLPPIGYVQFCHRHPAECRTEAQAFHRVELSPQRWQDLVLINKAVNDAVNPVTDHDLYGELEYWTFPRHNGDCEDYVLLKRRMLMERGWPMSSLLITVVLDENGDGHAVLTARTSDGDFILDNKNNNVKAWNEVPYQFIKRQSYKNQRIWMSLIPEPEHFSLSLSNVDRR